MSASQHPGTPTPAHPDTTEPSMPKQVADLRDTTRCPSCLIPLRATTCDTCGLDLAQNQAAALAVVSLRAADLLDERHGILAAMHAESRRRREIAAEDRATIATTQDARPFPSPVDATAPPRVAPEPSFAAPMDAAPAPAEPKDPRAHMPLSQPPAAARRSGVQIALLITGVSLLSVFAIFFTVYAFINFGLAWRAAIMGVVTVLAFTGASLLRRRALTASSEAVAVLALVFVYLDAFALRANGLLGLDAVDARTFWGVVLLLSAVGFIAWFRLAGVRAASLVGYAVAAPGVGVLASRLTDGLADPSAVYAVALAVAAAGMVQHSATLPSRDNSDGAPPTRRAALPERILVTASSAPAILAAAIAALGVLEESDFGSAVALFGCAAIAALHAWLHARGRGGYDRVSAVVWGGAAGAALAAAAAGYGLRSVAWENSLPQLTIALPTLTIAVMLTWLRRRAAGATRGPVTASAIAAGAVAAITLLPAAVMSLAMLAIRVVTLFADSPSDPARIPSEWRWEQLEVILVLLLGLVAVFGAAAALDRLRRALPALAVGLAVVLLLTPAQLPDLWSAVAAWAVIAAVALAMLLTGRGPRVAATTGTLGGVTLAWLTGWGADATWPFTSALAVVAAALSLRVVRAAWARATVTALGTAVLTIAGMAAGEQLLNGNAAAPATLAVAAAVLVLAAAPALSAVHPERRAALWTALAFATCASIVVIATWSPAPEETALTIVAGTLFVVGLLATALPERTRSIERTTAAILSAPAAAMTIAVAADTWLEGSTPVALALGLVAAVAAGLSLLASMRGTPEHSATATPSPRWAFDAGAIATLLPALGFALGGALHDEWTVLALVAVTLTLVATSGDGLVGSHSNRRHVGWAALAFATGALWWALSDASNGQTEPYVLPPAAALVAVALLIRRRESRAGRERAGVSAWVLFLGLTLAILPLTVAAAAPGDDAFVRAIATLTASALLLVAAAVIAARGVRHRPGLRGLAAAASAAALFGVVGITVLRSLDAIGGAVAVEAWLAPGTVALLLASVLLSGATEAHSPGSFGLGRRAALPLFLGTIALATVIEVAASTADADPAIRLTLVLGLLSLLHVAALRWRVRPLGVITAWSALGLAAATAAVALPRVEHVEHATLPLAFALLVTGGITMHRHPERGSWSTLGPGLGLLLLPSLAATSVEPQLWRLIALGIVGVLVVLVGVFLRLQAPFLLGIVVVLVHALRTFAPQIRAVYESADWFVWAGVGGLIVMFIAIRYEQRMRDLKRVVTRIAALR